MSTTPTLTVPPPCEWCGQPTDKPAKLCHRCQIIKAEETHIWEPIPGQRQ